MNSQHAVEMRAMRALSFPSSPFHFSLVVTVEQEYDHISGAA
jgi:hypothetical protein